jgi:tetratricopeptide (TPR) repeat protein
MHSPASPTGPSRALLVSVLAVVGMLAVLAWAGTFTAPFVFDDAPAVTANPSLRPPRTWQRVLWPEVDQGATVAGRPLLNLSFALNYAWGGLDVRGYHAVNLALHVASAWLLFGIVRRTLRDPAAGWMIAAGIAVLWMLHPLQTESVTYIAQRAESLGSFWILLTLYGFVRAVTSARGSGWLALSLSACFLGVLAKETIVVAPVLVLLHDRTWFAGSFREAWRLRRGYYVGLALSWLPLALVVAAGSGRGGTAGFGAGITPWSYLLTQCEAITLYLWRTIWPVGLVFDYGVNVAGGLGEVWPQALLLLALVGGTIWALVRRPTWGYFGSVFLVLLAPSSSIVPVVSQTMAEHRMYLALAAPVAALAFGMWRALGRRSLIVMAILAGGLFCLTQARNEVYRSELSLWADTIAKRPENGRAYHNLGLAEFARGNLDEAARLVREAIARQPNVAEPNYSLGLILARQGKTEEAIASYQIALRLDPEHAAAHNNLGNVLLTARRGAEAGAHFAEAVRLQPGLAVARNSYGSWLIDQGRFAEGLAECERAIRLDPGMATAHFNAGNACVGLGRLGEAEQKYREAIALKSDYAEGYNNLGNVLLEQDRVEEALKQYAEAVRLDAEYFDPRRNLAFVLLQQGRAREALPHLERLAQQAPTDAEVARALAYARSQAR